VSGIVWDENLPDMRLRLEREGSLLTIFGEGNRMLVDIGQDGALTFGEGYDPDEAARRFWEAMARLAPRC
jgi:hypothetical protein